jgi:hypothetical protein
MPWSRASSLDRAVVCPASTHLATIGFKLDRAQKAADWGTIIHSWKETGQWPLALSGRWAGKVPLMFQRRQANLAAAGKDRLDLWPADGRHEVSYALNTSTLTVGTYYDPTATQEQREAWKKGHGDEWLTGTADYVGDVLGRPWVDDLKTGNREYLPADPWELWQLRMYALCEAILTGAGTVLVSITSWPQYPADVLPIRVWAEVTRATLLDEVASTLEQARVLAMASRRKLDARPGVHCGRWVDRQGEVHYLCDSAINCPSPYEPPDDGDVN